MTSITTVVERKYNDNAYCLPLIRCRVSLMRIVKVYTTISKTNRLEGRNLVGAKIMTGLTHWTIN